MAKYQCKTCGAVYLNPQRDGASYFHGCSPVHNPDYDGQFVISEKGDRRPKGPLDPDIPEMLEHPQKRDENVEVKPDGKVAPKAEGAGKETRP